MTMMLNLQKFLLLTIAFACISYKFAYKTLPFQNQNILRPTNSDGLNDLHKLYSTPFTSDANSLSTKVFASYVIYKGKGAVSVKPIPPSFSDVQENTQSNGNYR